MDNSAQYDSSSENISSGRWTKQEHQRFIEAINLFGKNWKKVQDHVGTRTGAQIRSHAQKFFTRLEREINKENIPDQGKEDDFRMPESDDKIDKNSDSLKVEKRKRKNLVRSQSSACCEQLENHNPIPMTNDLRCYLGTELIENLLMRND